MHSEYLANLEMLMEIPIFGGLPIEALKLIAYLCARESFKPGEVLCRQHEEDAHAYLVLEGTVSVLREDEPEKVLGEFGPGEFFGGLSLFWDSRRLFTLKAKSRVVCLMLSREKLQKTMAQFPSIGATVFRNIAERIHEWESRFLGEHGKKCPQCSSYSGVTLI